MVWMFQDAGIITCQEFASELEHVVRVITSIYEVVSFFLGGRIVDPVRPAVELGVV